MGKKFWVALFVVVLMALSMVGNVWAVDATEALNPQAEPVLLYGKSVEKVGIDKIPVGPNKAKRFSSSSLISDTPLRIYAVSFYSNEAGDMIGIYNDTTATGPTLEFEAALAANTSSLTLDLKGLRFDDLYVAVIDSVNSIVTVTYDDCN